MAIMNHIHLGKLNLTVIVTFLLLLFCSNHAWSTSASISVSGNEGAIPLNASAIFTNHKHCDTASPPNCSYQDWGWLYVYQDGQQITRVYGNGSASWSTSLDGGVMTQGEHTFSAKAVDSKWIPDTATTTITIDNTPTITVNSPGLVEGAFDITGTVNFKESIRNNEGFIRLFIDGIELYALNGRYWIEGTSVNWSFSDAMVSCLMRAFRLRGYTRLKLLPLPSIMPHHSLPRELL